MYNNFNIAKTSSRKHLVPNAMENIRQIFTESKERLSANVPLVTQGVDPGYNTVVFGQIISSWVNLQS